MDDEFLKNCIDNGYENEYLDYKLDIYIFKKGDDSGKVDFLTDVLSMANSNYIDDKYIIVGEKVKPDGTRIKKGIKLNDVKDSADYQQLVSENIEPAISIEFKILEHENLKYGIFKISNCNNRPYLLKKDYANLKAGFMKIRHGSRNDKMTRFDLDSIYNSKKPIEKTDFKIYGINNREISDNINIKKIEFKHKLLENSEIINEKFKEIDNFIIDDIVENNESSLSKALNAMNLAVFQEKPIEFEERDISYIEGYIKALKIKVSNDFYYIGNATKRWEGMSSYGIGMAPKYKVYGSPKSVEKYNKIKDLNKMMSEYIHLKEFEEKVKKIYFLELAIKQIGNIADEDIEVNLFLPENAYIDIEDFPQVHESIVDIVDQQYAEKLFLPQCSSEISAFRKPDFPKSVNIPTSSFPLIGGYRNEYETLDGIYDYIDYDIQNEKAKTSLSFTIKNIKVDEIMMFPGKILLKKPIERIEYYILSKKSKQKINGEIIIQK